MGSAVPAITAAAASSLPAVALSMWFRFHLWKGRVNRQERGISSRQGVVNVLLQPRGSMNCLTLYEESKVKLAISGKTLFQRVSGNDYKRVSLLT